jgi:hypothetical protein
MDEKTKPDLFPPTFEGEDATPAAPALSILAADPNLTAGFKLIDEDLQLEQPGSLVEHPPAPPADALAPHEAPTPARDAMGVHAASSPGGDPTAEEMTYASRLPSDHPGLRLQRPQARSLRRGPIVAVAIVLCAQLRSERLPERGAARRRRPWHRAEDDRRGDLADGRQPRHHDQAERQRPRGLAQRHDVGQDRRSRRQGDRCRRHNFRQRLGPPQEHRGTRRRRAPALRRRLPSVPGPRARPGAREGSTSPGQEPGRRPGCAPGTSALTRSPARQEPRARHVTGCRARLHRARRFLSPTQPFRSVQP